MNEQIERYRETKTTKQYETHINANEQTNAFLFAEFHICHLLEFPYLFSLVSVCDSHVSGRMMIIVASTLCV